MGARVGRQATTTAILKAVITTHWQASPNQLYTTTLTSTHCNAPINPTIATCYNYDKEDYFPLSCPELKDIKKIEEGETSNKLGKEKP